MKYVMPARVGVQCKEREGEDVDANAAEGASPRRSDPAKARSGEQETLLMLKSPVT